LRRTVAILLVLVAPIGLIRLRAAIAQTGTPTPGVMPLTPTQQGKTVYEAHCVECHGDSGHGDGPAAAFLNPRPRDFTTGKYKIRSTDAGTAPTDDDLIRSVRQGVYGTSMPPWDRVLSDTDIRDVVAYLKTLAPNFTDLAPKEINPAATIPSSPESIARGQNVYAKLQCGKCHGSDGRGAGAVTTTFEDDWKQPIVAADLTEPWTFRGGATSRDLFLRFRAGMTGTPMPSFADAASDADLWDLANYVLSIGRKPVWSMTPQEVADLYARLDAEAKSNPVKRGAYLVDALGCSGCHSPVDSGKHLVPGMRLAGGVRVRIEPFGDFPTGNLTSDKETGLGSWSDEEIKRAITKGILRDGTRLLPFPMDYASFSTMTDDDLNALVAYLRTVPPVANRVPKPTWTPLPFYLWGKFKMLILGIEPPLVFYAGNAGTLQVAP
jgi:mono/diheme cytochrome c family protein